MFRAIAQAGGAQTFHEGHQGQLPHASPKMRL